ncbi:MAG: YicC family protein [Xanthomonadales bacterium]|nr:YicC family protein [Gammaproteobacteria bacterium]MBT8051688.1 YicC family protein [Gammaproteobacteria bacterium]MBT8057123.1 YicC family protein [Gammaproteobacteria bacterium]NNJ80233.1 YicC family protein [Xanthomonadales bacterium]NNL05250.1 YicC family protein [Xanthomonadales bacterium]
MIRSMTGFASVERLHDFGRLTWELRSVNHRYLEIGFRVPEEFRSLEPDIRRILGQHLSRGKVDANLKYAPSADAASSSLVVNRKLLDRLFELHGEMCQAGGVDQEADTQSLMRWPGVIEESAPDPQPLHAAALHLLGEAATGLQSARGREGKEMDAAIRERLDTIEARVGQVREWLPEIRDGLRQKLLNRVADLKQPLEPGRLEQEVAFLAQKIDVDEELDRLAAHVKEARLVLERDEPVGRRLDFLMQEFNRESNTLSSKSVDNRTTQVAVELKVAIEQMREQVQNIE